MLKSFVWSIPLACLLTVAVNAQTGTGTPSYGSLFPINAYEEINLSSLNIVVHAPVRSKGGPMPMAFALTLNVPVYPSFPTITAAPASLATGVALGGVSEGVVAINQLCPDGHTTTNLYDVYVIVDGYGTMHPFASPVHRDTARCI